MASQATLETDLELAQQAKTAVLTALAAGKTHIEIELRSRRIRSNNLKDLLTQIDRVIADCERRLSRLTYGFRTQPRVMHDR